MYEYRFYRDKDISGDQDSFYSYRVVVEETDLYIKSSSKLEPQLIKKLVRKYRAQRSSAKFPVKTFLKLGFKEDLLLNFFSFRWYLYP